MESYWRRNLFLILFFIFGIVQTSSTSFAEQCEGDDCTELWIAAQDVGKPSSFFVRDGNALLAADIKVGDRLRSRVPLNVRANPADWRKTIIVLSRGIEVRVEEIASVPTYIGPAQLWLRVTVVEARAATKTKKSETPAETVLRCYSANAAGRRTTTIQEMRECVGGWVTPRALISCGVGAYCPILEDTEEGRAKLDAALTAVKLTRTSVLKLDPTLFPQQPTAQAIEACKKTSPTEQAFQECAAGSVGGENYRLIRECFTRPTEGERLACFTGLTKSPELTKLVGCFAGGKPTLDKMGACLANEKTLKTIDSMRDCVTTTVSGDAARSCVLGGLNPVQRSIAECGAKADTASVALKCLEPASPELKRARALAACHEKSKSDQDEASCIAGLIGGDSAKTATCLAKKDRIEIAACALGDKPEVRVAMRTVTCLREGTDVGGLIANCTEGVLDQKTAHTIACVSEAGSDKSRLVSCATSAVLPPETARLVGCAASSQTATGFALCAAGPVMNEEFRIAAECAVQTGGNPVGFAGCTAGRLTARELTKCFTGRVGQDCFGPNNTIVAFYRNGFHDLTQGPGKNNEVVKAIDQLDKLAGGPNSVIHKPLGGGGSVFNDPGQIGRGAKDFVEKAKGELGKPLPGDIGGVIDPRRWKF